MRTGTLNNKLQHVLADARWHCEPPSWSLDDSGLQITTGERTDFWQDTWYGFQRDDGHFLGTQTTGDFAATLSFTGQYEKLYDQAGLMLRIDNKHWIKAGIEHSDGLTNFSVVVTRENSDWSVIPAPRVTGRQSIRATRVGSAVLVHYLTNNNQWQLMRVCHFPANAPILLGPMACSPERAGFRCTFHSLQLSAPDKDALHG